LILDLAASNNIIICNAEHAVAPAGNGAPPKRVNKGWQWQAAEVRRSPDHPQHFVMIETGHNRDLAARPAASK
jgi:hypothetical protein